MIEGLSVADGVVLSRLPSRAAAMPEIPPAAATSGFAASVILLSKYWPNRHRPVITIQPIATARIQPDKRAHHSRSPSFTSAGLAAGQEGFAQAGEPDEQRSRQQIQAEQHGSASITYRPGR